MSPDISPNTNFFDWEIPWGARPALLLNRMAALFTRECLAHNLKVTGSNPVPATKKPLYNKDLQSAFRGAFCIWHSTSTPHQHWNRKTATAGIGGHWQAATGVMMQTDMLVPTTTIFPQ